MSSARLFSQVPVKRPKRNAFHLSHNRKTSFNMGQLIPILCEEVVPGDKFRGRCNALIRLAPMLAPIMHEVNVFTHFFFVPNRLLWDNWETFISGGESGIESPPFPQFLISGASLRDPSFRPLISPGSLADHLGIGYGGTFQDDRLASQGSSLRISQLPFRACSLIYNEYYRDQNLQEPLPVPKTDGILSTGNNDEVVRSLLALRNRAWQKDYFTSALPWAQRGAPITIPITGNVPVTLDTDFGNQRVTVPGDLRGNSTELRWNSFQNPDPYNSAPLSIQASSGSAQTQANIDPNGSLRVDLESNSGVGVTVNDFRRSIRLQEWAENNARGGSRYTEQIRSHFGIVSSDARLQRPEFLGGGRSPIVISEVLQTSSTDSTTPQGNPAGQGLSAHGSHTWSKFIEEHGYIIGFISVMPKTAYQNGIRRHFLKDDKFDFYFPEFAHLGEQPVWLSELYADSDDLSDPKSTFGYQPRYAEYKFISDSVHGDFKGDTSEGSNLDFWHMGRKFQSRPALNETFVVSDPTNRIWAVTSDDYDHLWCLVRNEIRAIRPMPRFGVPTI